MDNMKTIYIVEDHQVIREGVQKYLETEGNIVRGFSCIKEAQSGFEKKVPDLLIQDVMLPDGNGFDFVREIKQSYDVPTIFLTAKVSEEDRIRGLELGADDYITKPFSLKELSLRVQAVLRRTEKKETKAINIVRKFTFENNSMTMDKNKHEVKLNGQKIALTSAEWKILSLLIDNKPNPVSRQNIIKTCFGYETDSYLRIADTHIKNLRAKLNEGTWIQTERSVGYRFLGDEQ